MLGPGARSSRHNYLFRQGFKLYVITHVEAPCSLLYHPPGASSFGYAVSNFIFLHLLSFNKKQTCKFGSYLHTAMTQPKKTPFDLAREERFCQQLSMQ